MELRVALTTSDYDRLVRFYCDGLGLEPAQLWSNGQGRAMILDMGRATLEIFDEAQAEAVDQIEVGRRVSGPVRFALRVPDLAAAMQRLLAHGATLVHPRWSRPGATATRGCRTPMGCRSRCLKSRSDPVQGQFMRPTPKTIRSTLAHLEQKPMRGWPT